ncbi:MAG: hypothetical protein LKI60_04385 [Bifidobacterium tibiigranuli]|jgi:hypothetical protein|nr:hypothetical protein [Bifidobacterium tibiigranuli]MCI1797467.1 hypothetical protein [Bifidobacterium tibiigranuli]
MIQSLIGSMLSAIALIALAALVSKLWPGMLASLGTWLYGSGTIYLSNAQPVVTASPASDLQISVNTSIPLIPLS